ncbi:MAG TPA: ATP-binding cassette domain-containing protein [Fluviicola sp.]|nr:ATP-binding cassette domain-containing protein [Fluviicola sp.]
MITVKSLSKSYGNNRVLKGIDLTFKEGEIAGVIGDNGAGKTTLFKCISALESFDGSVEYDKGILKNNIGFLEANPYFFPKMTGLEYLQLMCNARDVKLDNLKQYNLFDLPLEKYAVNYSTGMKKKLALTGILLQKNQVFILDEPFNGVDIHSNMIIEEIILKLKEAGKVVILSSHIFSTLRDTCDYLLHLKGGMIAKNVERADFEKVEEEMKGDAIGDKIGQLIMSLQ